MNYSAAGQLRVLKAVEEQCGLSGRDPIRLFVPGMEAEEISLHCAVLFEVKLINAIVLHGEAYDVYLPIRLTWEGVEALSEAKKSFWEYAQQVGVEAVKHFTGFNVGAAVEFYKATVRSFNREKPNA